MKKLLLRSILLPIWAIPKSIGLDIRNVRRIFEYPKFLISLFRWKKLGGTVNILFPVVGEWGESSGVANGHYFHQDLLVARFVFENNPVKHVDIGSRVDGFVAHVASFREIEIIDVRELRVENHNIKFRCANLMSLQQDLIGCCDSLSCLHAIEHFGLGRYGDPINPEGHKQGFLNMVRLLKKGGLFYISFPIGQARVEFNAHRVFSPGEIIGWNGVECLELLRFDFIDDAGDLHVCENISTAEKMNLAYGCGVYTFRKTHDAQ